MRALHVVKTVDGAKWAIDQVRELVAHGVEVHVALPSLHGRFRANWQETGARLHVLPINFPVRMPWQLPSLLLSVRRLVDAIQPDIIHSHFFGTTLVLRYALGKKHPIPRIFQVPGPLHLEHRLYRHWELSSAGDCDYWVASSRCIFNHYLKAGIDEKRLFLSYYGNQPLPDQGAGGRLRTTLGIGEEKHLIGNINHLYPPKWYLGQTKGLKRHEDVIDALNLVLSRRSDVIGVLIGGEWGNGHAYEQRLRKQAERVGRGQILMPGYMRSEMVSSAWADFSLCVHVPASENCGGVIEPLLAGVPVIAARVGGLPEVILEGKTGVLVQPGNIEQLAAAILSGLDVPQRLQMMAKQGQRLVKEMFDVRRTASEIRGIYQHLLHNEERPSLFDSHAYVLEK